MTWPRGGLQKLKKINPLQSNNLARAMAAQFIIILLSSWWLQWYVLPSEIIVVVLFPQQMVWTRERLQCISDRLIRTQLRRSFQFLLKKVHNENCAYVSWSGETYHKWMLPSRRTKRNMLDCCKNVCVFLSRSQNSSIYLVLKVVVSCVLNYCNL